LQETAALLRRQQHKAAGIRPGSQQHRKSQLPSWRRGICSRLDWIAGGKSGQQHKAASQGGTRSPAAIRASWNLQLLLEGSLAATSWQQLWQCPARQSTWSAVESLQCRGSGSAVLVPQLWRKALERSSRCRSASGRRMHRLSGSSSCSGSAPSLVARPHVVQVPATVFSPQLLGSCCRPVEWQPWQLLQLWLWAPHARKDQQQAAGVGQPEANEATLMQRELSQLTRRSRAQQTAASQMNC
jgi:hypothetical protein